MKPHVTLFGIPVRFDPSFLFLLLFLGFLFLGEYRGNTALVLYAIWAPLVTGAILLHELGHALVGRAFGLQPFIVLYGMGGLTSFPARDHRALPHRRRILITLAGPLAGIVAGGAVLLAMIYGHLPHGTVSGIALTLFVETTLGWGVLNLIPMLPLDGGQIVATVLDKLFGPRGFSFARIASMGLAIALALLVAGVALVAGGTTIDSLFLLFLLGSLGLNNYRAYQMERRWQRDEPLAQALQAAFAALEAGDTMRVRKLAEAIAERAATPGTKAQAAHLLAWAHVLEGDGERALIALASAPPGHRPDAFLEGTVLAKSGRPSEAIQPFVEALVDRGDDVVADALADAVAGAGRLDELIGLLESRERSSRAGAAPLELVAHGLFTRGEHALACELYERVFARFGDATDAFNAACAALRLGDEARAVRQLERAIDAGLADPTILDTDEDLAPLRGTPAMDTLRARAGLG